MVNFYILCFLSLIIYNGLSQFFYGVLECNQNSLIAFWKAKTTESVINIAPYFKMKPFIQEFAFFISLTNYLEEREIRTWVAFALNNAILA